MMPDEAPKEDPPEEAKNSSASEEATSEPEPESAPPSEEATKEAAPSKSEASASRAGEHTDDRHPIRVHGTSPRADHEKRRTRVLVQPRSKPAAASIEPDATLEGRLVLYVLGELEKEDRDELREEINADEEAQHRLSVVRRHLELHQSLPRVRPAAGSFLRLTTRMRNEGYLAYAYPGWFAIWRRAFGLGILSVLILSLALWAGFFDQSSKSLAGVPFGSFVRYNAEGELKGRAISLNTAISTGNHGGYLWLSSPATGVATEIRIDSTSSFVLHSRSEIELSAGELTAVSVHEAALHKDGFKVVTTHGTLRVRDADFSIEAQSGRTVVCVARGRVQIQRPNSDLVRTVDAGMCGELMENEGQPIIYPWIQIDVQPYNQDSMALVRIINHSTHATDLRSVRYLLGDAYQIRLVKDLQPGDYETWSYEGKVSDVTRPDSHRGERFHDDGRVTLEPVGKTNVYEFFADLSEDTIGWEARDLSLSLSYVGDVYTPDFGPTDFTIKSKIYRINLKTARKAEGEESIDE